MSKKNILVIGAGSWGTAIANVLADNEHNIKISSIEPDIIEEINNRSTTNKYLPGVKLSPNLKAIASYANYIKECDFVFVVVPATVANHIFQEIAAIADISPKCLFVICSKGLDPESLQLLTDSFEKVNPNKECCILSGPNFAIEVASRMPSITNICSTNKESAQSVIDVLNNDYFKAIYDSQPITAEICGIVKNILAIGCGIVDGLELGVNSKAAIITYGTQEIKALCKFFDCNGFIATAAGFGDIFLTCSSTKSRNNSLGKKLASGEKFQQIVSNTSTTYEGAVSALSISKLCQKYDLNLPLCQLIHDIIYQNLDVEEIRQKVIKTLIN